MTTEEFVRLVQQLTPAQQWAVLDLMEELNSLNEKAC